MFHSKYAEFAMAMLEDVSFDYRIAMFPLDAADEAMVLYQSAQDVFGVGAKKPNVKYAVTHFSGTVYEPDPTYAETAPHDAVCISMTVGDYGAKTALATLCAQVCSSRYGTEGCVGG